MTSGAAFERQDTTTRTGLASRHTGCSPRAAAIASGSRTSPLESSIMMASRAGDRAPGGRLIWSLTPRHTLGQSTIRESLSTGIESWNWRRCRMQKKAMFRVSESGVFQWPWNEPFGLLIMCGAAGGGGGGALCLEELNLYGAGGGGGGGGGEATSVKRGETTYRVAGGNGGSGGDGGGLHDGVPVRGQHGKGCYYGDGGTGGRGADVPPADGASCRTAATAVRDFREKLRLLSLPIWLLVTDSRSALLEVAEAVAAAKGSSPAIPAAQEQTDSCSSFRY